jgi:hypothetical protein
LVFCMVCRSSNIYALGVGEGVPLQTLAMSREDELAPQGAGIRRGSAWPPLHGDADLASGAGKFRVVMGNFRGFNLEAVDDGGTTSNPYLVRLRFDLQRISHHAGPNRPRLRARARWLVCALPDAALAASGCAAACSVARPDPGSVCRRCATGTTTKNLRQRS